MAAARRWPSPRFRGTFRTMGNPALDLSRLSRDEQFELLDQLWETLRRDPKALPLSPAQTAELDRRLDELEAEGPVGLSWDEVVTQARARRR